MRSSIETAITSIRSRARDARRNERPIMPAWATGLLFLVVSTVAGPAFAWIYPEHRDIALLAVENLDPERRAAFDALWREARGTQEQRLCEAGADAAQGVKLACIDWAALSAIAGDHSCSSQEMTTTVLTSDWILKVADVAARLKTELAKISVLPPVEQLEGSKDVIADFRRRIETEAARAARVNVLRTADNQLQSADPQYATRAGSSTAHFLLARPSTGTTGREYAALTLHPGSQINALGVYAWYHLSALQKASRLASEQLDPEQREALARAMLFDEGFADHFLEDAFAAGHVAGTWGKASQRQGTHDYYNAAGLEVFLWKGGPSVVLTGDAHMRPEDAERASAAVRGGLDQLLDEVSGHPQGEKLLPDTPSAPAEPDTFDVCKNQVLPSRPDFAEQPEAYRKIYIADLTEALAPTPIPGLGPGLGSLPRFRSEVGPFIGLAGSIDGKWVDGGFTPSEGGGFIGGVELAARAGVGLDGVMGDAGDGLVFVSLGLRGDTSSSNSISGTTGSVAGNISAAIPSRTGVSTRLRMPFYLVPGDLLFLAPMYFFAPERYQSMAVTAGNGGLIPWQSGMATGIGRFQFVLGRELGVTFYGLSGDDRVLAPGAVPNGPPRVVDYTSTAFDLPILEYHPYRSFASNQSSTLLFQLFTDWDVPHSSSVVSPVGAANVELRTVWSVGLRMVFDWRHYP